MIDEKIRIVVMGGSFNPPTMAHFQLMKTAVQELKAHMGIFVPVSQAYLKRKMRKTSDSNICLKEEQRLAMLSAMCRGSASLSVSEMELCSVQFCTYDTMRKLQELYPNAELYFLMGADKLELFAKWSENSDFLDCFRAVIFDREGISPKRKVLEDERLRRYYNTFVFLPQPEGIEEISSTRIRRYLIKGDKEVCEKYLHPAVWDIFKNLNAEDFPKEIESFQGKYEFLSNAYPISIKWQGQEWLCAEAAFQAARCKHTADFFRFLHCSAQKAKQRAGKVEPREDWEEVKLEIMEEILYAKFSQHPHLAQKLKETGDALLIAGNNKKDTFWGRNLYTCRGQNHLGKLLMKTREKL